MKTFFRRCKGAGQPWRKAWVFGVRTPHQMFATPWAWSWSNCKRLDLPFVGQSCLQQPNSFMESIHALLVHSWKESKRNFGTMSRAFPSLDTANWWWPDCQLRQDRVFSLLVICYRAVVGALLPCRFSLVRHSSAIRVHKLKPQGEPREGHLTSLGYRTG